METAFKGISRIKISDLSAVKAIADPDPNSPVEILFTASALPLPTECSKSVGNAYIDLVELDEALCLYYIGGLDYVEATQVNAPLTELIPGKTLISQLDQDAMTQALSALSAGDRQTIEIVHKHRYVEAAYAEALINLSEEIGKIL
jgi:hypothetical protein